MSADVVAAGAYAFTLVWIAAEVAFEATRSDRRALWRRGRTALAMGVGAFVLGFGYTVVFRGVWTMVAHVAPAALVELWRDHAVLGWVAAFVAWDAVGFAYHWVGHYTRVGWAAHQPHHTGDTFDITLALRQTWLPLHALLCQPVLAVAGFDFTVIVACAALSNAWQALEHSTLIPRPPRWFAAVFVTPAAHRHHHGRAAAPVNLGPVLTVWDRLCGSWRPADADAPRAYGIAASGGVVAIEFAGWRRLLQRADEVDHVVGVEGIALELGAVGAVE